MQWRQGDAGPEILQGLFGDEAAVLEPFPSVYHPVPHCLDLRKRTYASMLFADQYAEHVFNARLMVDHLALELHLVAVLLFMPQERSFQSDFFDNPLRQEPVVLNVEKLIFDGRTSAV